MNDINHKEILEKAIQKAIDGGWFDYQGLESIELLEVKYERNPLITLKGWVEFVDEGHTDESQTTLDVPYKLIIFNHDFAKALWGESEHDANGYVNKMFTCTICGVVAGEEGSANLHWQYHLQQMVIAEDPIKYLGGKM